MVVLADYAREGRFPLNYYRHERIPVFIDEHDTHCAAGHLMRQTGQEAMAQRMPTLYAHLEKTNRRRTKP